MKKKQLFIKFVPCLLVFFIACGPYVNLEIKKDDRIGFKKAGGFTTPERGLEIIEYQEQILTRSQLERMLQEAYAAGNQARITQVKSWINDYGSKQAAPEGYRNLGIQNLSDNHVVEIQSDPFTGLTLSPRESSTIRQPVKIGIYRLTFKWHEINTDNHGVKSVNINVDRYRSNPLWIK